MTQGLKEILRSAQSEREKSQLSSNGLLMTSIQAALAKLSMNYGYNDPFNPAGSDVAEYYKMFESVAENFAQLGKELLKMRSSYLPYEVYESAMREFNEPGGSKSKKISEIIDADTALESYENTFFRLLGMPSLADIYDQKLTTVTRNGKLVSPDEDIGLSRTKKILQKREMDITDRLDYPSATAYDFLSGTVSSLDRLFEIGFRKEKLEALEQTLKLIKDLNSAEKLNDETKRIASALYGIIDSNRGVDVAVAESDMRVVQDLPKVFDPDLEELNNEGGQQTDYRTVMGMGTDASTTLAFVLDIALRLYEPDVYPKVTLNMQKHLWNEHVLKKPDPSMLNLHEPSNFWEYSYLLFPPVQDPRIATCINEPSKMVAEPFLPESLRVVNGHRLRSTLLEAVIRIRLDIVSGFPVGGPQLSPTGMALASDGESRPITPDEMGLLEGILIIRLFSALKGFAQDAREKVKVAHAVQHRCRRSPEQGADRPKNDQSAGLTGKKKKGPEELKLDATILLEESLLLLFGDGSTPEALSFQEGVSRNSGVKNAHLMSAAMAVLDVPRRWAQKELGKIKEIEQRQAGKPQDAATGGLRQQVGMAKGVGAVDLLAFMIALFTCREEVLINLLNDRQFNYMKKEYPDGFFDNFERQGITTGNAVREVSERAYDAYQLFRFMLSQGEETFVYPVLTEISLS